MNNFEVCILLPLEYYSNYWVKVFLDDLSLEEIEWLDELVKNKSMKIVGAMNDKKSREIYSECKTMYKMFVEELKPKMIGDVDVEVRMEATATASVMMKVVNKYFDVVEPLLTTQREIVVNETRIVEVLEHKVGMVKDIL